MLERRLGDALCGQLPRRLRRRAWPVAIDWHLSPYYGEPHASKNELYYGKPRQGTKTFHAYASACIVEHGRRYTLALSYGSAMAQLWLSYGSAMRAVTNPP